MGWRELRRTARIKYTAQLHTSIVWLSNKSNFFGQILTASSFCRHLHHTMWPSDHPLNYIQREEKNRKHCKNGDDFENLTFYVRLTPSLMTVSVTKVLTLHKNLCIVRMKSPPLQIKISVFLRTTYKTYALLPCFKIIYRAGISPHYHQYTRWCHTEAYCTCFGTGRQQKE